MIHVDANKVRHWKELAAQLRVDSIASTTAAGSGHPTSAMSAADLMAVLMTDYLRYDFAQPERATNDRLVFSKGHAAPLLYAMLKAAGVIERDELMSLRKLGSRLEGHPNPRVLPWVDVATGSLGQGIGMGMGMALCSKRITKVPFHVWVLLGDSEMAEGSVWEAFDKAAYYELNNLVAIVDMNRLGQRGETELGWNGAAYAARARAFGWHAIELDGHDVVQIDRALAEAATGKDRPTCLVAKTIKGQGVSFLANAEGWHGKALSASEETKAIAELGGERPLTVKVHAPKGPAGVEAEASAKPRGKHKWPTYELHSMVATRTAYGDALAALGAARPDVVVLDAEVGNSTHSETFLKAFPDRFFEMFIAEQLMVSAAVGLSALGQIPFASTFACFLTRAFDQIRMGAISNSNLYLCGSHAGVSIGEDGPSQMGLEDLAMMRAVFGSTVLYPCDAGQTAALVRQMVDRRGIVYLRTTRGKTPVIYAHGEDFPVGGSKVLRSSGDDAVTVVAAGITVHEALTAHARLAAEGVACRVIDAYSVKPIDGETLREAVKATKGRLVVVEDHWPEGGLGDAVLEAVAGAGIGAGDAVRRLAVRTMPGSGTPDELLRVAGIDADGIIGAVKQILSAAGSGA